MAADLGEIELALGRRGEESNHGGDGVFLTQAELVALLVEAGVLLPSLFIGREGRFAGEIFSRHASVLRVSCFLRTSIQATKVVVHSSTISVARLGVS